MTIKAPLRSFLFIALTTLLMLSSYLAGSIFVNDTAASSQPDFPASGRSFLSPDQFTSNSDAAALTAAVMPAQPLVPACPPPTTQIHNECVLTADAVLTEDVTLDKTLVLRPRITLNCSGHKLTPRSSGTDFTEPQVGIFLNGARRAQIQNCVIDGFDFGIFAINTKRLIRPEPIVISDNIINARYAGISLMAVDDAEITRNEVTYQRSAGRGLYIGRNSDSNKVSLNKFVADFTAQDAGAFRAPGPRTEQTNPLVTGPGAAVVVAQLEGGEPILLNVVIGTKVFQLTTTSAPNNLVANRNFSNGNIIEGNTILLSTKAVDGIAMAVPQGTIVTGNKVQGRSRAAIRAGMQMGLGKVFPGTCRLAPSRLCLENSDCNIVGVDRVNHGPCKLSLTMHRKVFWISRDTRIEDNTITGPLEIAGISSTALNTTIKGNTIDGRNTPESAGIQLLSRFGLTTSTVTRNSVSNVDAALNLIQTVRDQDADATIFKARISLNDFTAYNTAVLTRRRFPPPSPAGLLYELRSELSVAERGNFWGTRICPGLNPGEVKNKEDDTVNARVTDCHSYVVSVAKTLGSLPKPCVCQVLNP